MFHNRNVQPFYTLRIWISFFENYRGKEYQLFPLFIKPRREGREGLRSTNAINPPDVLETREPRFIKVYIPFTREIKNIRFFRIQTCIRFLDGDKEEEMTIINNNIAEI